MAAVSFATMLDVPVPWVNPAGRIRSASWWQRYCLLSIGVGLGGADIGHSGERRLRAGRYFIQTDVVQRHVLGETCATDSVNRTMMLPEYPLAEWRFDPAVITCTLLLSGDGPQAIVPAAVVPHIHTQAAHSGAVHIEKAELRLDKPERSYSGESTQPNRSAGHPNAM